MPEKPRIAICMEYPLAQIGGVEVLVGALVRGLAADFSIVLVSDDSADSVTAAGLAPLIVQHLRWRSGDVGVRTARDLAAGLKQAGSALAHFHFGGTWAWGSRIASQCPAIHVARLGIPVVITNHSVHPPMEGFCGSHRPLWQKLPFFLFVWVNRLRVLAAAKHEFAVSIADRDLERKLFWPVRHRIRHMYHSNLDESEPSTGLPPEQRLPVVLVLGTIAPRKGQRILVEAFERIAGEHRDWVLRIFGRIADQQYFQGIHAGPRVQFAGKLPAAEIPAELDRAAIFAMPSLSEGLGLSLQEALFHGCACVGTRVGGIPELIEHEQTGLLVPPNDSKALAEALLRLISDPALRRRLAANGRASILARGMTRQQMIRQHTELYHALLAGPPE